jgi:hypothetical protein
MSTVRRVTAARPVPAMDPTISTLPRLTAYRMSNEEAEVAVEAANHIPIPRPRSRLIAVSPTF